MRLLRLAVEKQRWDLFAHTIVLATARILSEGGRPDARKRRQKESCKKEAGNSKGGLLYDGSR